MLEKPDLEDLLLINCLLHNYSLHVTQLHFLALGADFNAAVYRAQTDDGSEYFVKLRSGAFNASSLSLPRFLHEHGAAYLIAPLLTQSGRAWTQR